MNYRDFNLGVSEAYDLFWQKNKLAVDNKGRTYRTKIPRVRPKPAYELDFRNKKKGTKDGKVY